METVKVQTGDIILFNRKRFLSKIIRWISKCPVSHSEILINIWDYPITLGATGAGVRGTDYSKIKKEKNIIILRYKKYIDGITYEQEKELATRACSKLGSKYDFGGLVYYQLVYQIFGRWIGRTRTEAEQSMYCTEYNAWCHQLDNWWTYSPEDFLNNKDFIIIYSDFDLSKNNYNFVV